MHLGVADHLGWAVAVTASSDHEIADRRRVELIEPGLPPAPIHHVGGAHKFHQRGGPPDDTALGALVADVRASVVRMGSKALEEVALVSPGPIASISLRACPTDFPDDIALQRRVPYESRADAIMYRRVLAVLANKRGWRVHFYDAKRVEAEAGAILGERADEVLRGPRATLGPPWSRDHRVALAATIVASRTESHDPTTS
jgi:hypothetical protein